MKKILFLLVVWAMVQQLPAQTVPDRPASTVLDSNVSFTPLLLFTNGMGRIFPFQDGQMLEVGRRYFMVAIPDRGFVFSNWQPVVVFNFTEYTQDASGGLVESTSTVIVPEGGFIEKPVLKFTVEPEQVLFDIPNVRTITESFGWQANFVPVERHRR